MCCVTQTHLIRCAWLIKSKILLKSLIVFLFPLHNFHTPHPSKFTNQVIFMFDMSGNKYL